MKFENPIYHFNFVINDRLSTKMPCDGPIETTHYELMEVFVEDTAFGGGIFFRIKKQPRSNMKVGRNDLRT